MSHAKNHMTRRRFVRTGLMALAAIPAGSLLATRPAHANEHLPKLSEDDPTAQGLSYQHDASQVQSAAYQEGALCSNCQLYTGDRSAQWGACNVFPGKLVNANGWCSAWVKAS